MATVSTLKQGGTGAGLGDFNTKQPGVVSVRLRGADAADAAAAYWVKKYEELTGEK